MRTLRPAAFTLVELLVVISIIVILVAILIPSMEKAVSLAQRASCAAQLHAQCIALKQYAIDDIGKRYPEPVTPGSGGNWPDGAMIIEWSDPALGPRKAAGQPQLFEKGYAPDASLFYCPGNPGTFSAERFAWGPTSDNPDIRADPWAWTYIQYPYWSGGFWSGSDPGRSLDDLLAFSAIAPSTTIMLTDNITIDVGADFQSNQSRSHETDRRDTVQSLDGTTYTNPPDGGNILTNDGGAFWRNFSETRIRLRHPAGLSYERDWFW